jgi:hypothetical protein
MTKTNRLDVARRGGRLAALLAFGACVACVPRERPGEEKKGAGGATAASAAAVERAGVGGAAKGERPPGPVPVPTAAKASAAAGGGASEVSPEPPAGTDDPWLTEVFNDDFERTGELGSAYRSTSSVWAIDRGRLCGAGAKNHPVWLARRLPVNARIEFQALSESEDGDIKAEFWGDGRSSAAGVSYTDATSYLTIFGGWKNRFHVLARLDEHAPDRREIKLERGAADPIGRTVEAHRVYQFRVERQDGHTVRWSVDGVEISSYPDEEPLRGDGHEHFGFNDWQVRVCFDNLRVTPLED